MDESGFWVEPCPTMSKAELGLGAMGMAKWREVARQGGRGQGAGECGWKLADCKALVGAPKRQLNGEAAAGRLADWGNMVSIMPAIM